MTIKIDLSKDKLFDTHGLARLKDGYMRDDETSPQERYAFVSKAFASNEEHAQRIYEYASNHWLSFSTPILAFGKNKGAMPISCYLPYLPDTRTGLVETSSESRWLSMSGGGVGLGLGLRGTGNKSAGVMAHLKTYDADTLAYKQGETRRGSIAAYLDISHPDIKQFITMRRPTSDENQRCLNLHHGVNISDGFMSRVEQLTKINDPELDKWELIDPHTKKVTDIVSVKELWQSILETRAQTGEPYLHFIDRSNEKLPLHQKMRGLSVKQSNLCSEVILPTDELRTAVCCLSSFNLEYYDDWKDHPQFVSDVVEFLDNVLEYFIQNAPASMSRAIYSAKRERSIGLGVLGFHALLQSKGIPFESALAVSLNKRIWKKLNEEATLATKRLAVERGACPDYEDAVNCGVILEYGPVRNSHLFAVAPTASSSIIMGNTSPSVEPYRANIFVQKTLSGSHVWKNKFLERLLEKHGKNTQEVWDEIIANEGSVQSLTFLDAYEKDTFKTSREIDQQWIIQHAADRQEYIDQAQSINLFVSADVSIEYLHRIHMMAWKRGLKTLYYLRSTSIRKADKVGQKTERVELKTKGNDEECLACQ